MKEDKPYIPWTEFAPPEHFEERKAPVTSWREQFLGNWEPSADCVFSRQRVVVWLERGEINREEAEILMRLEYTTIKGKRRFIG